jgi:hypothetical protein
MIETSSLICLLFQHFFDFNPGQNGHDAKMSIILIQVVI